MTSAQIGWVRMVSTLRGPVAPGRFGVTLGHDRVLMDAGIPEAFDDVNFNEALIMSVEVGRFRDAGGGAVCDPSNIDVGRTPLACRGSVRRRVPTS